MNPEDMGKELDRLWSKVSSVSSADELLPFPAAPETAHEITADAISMLKRRHSAEAQEWAEMIDAKERTLGVAKQRQAALDIEVASLREQLREGEAGVFNEMLDVRSKLESGMKALEDERAANEAEQKAVTDILRATRERLAAETDRHKKLERQWGQREQQYLLDLKEFQTLSGRHQEEAADAEERAGHLSENLREAKNAIEKTLAELLLERQVREQTEAERARAFKKVEEVERHFKELSHIWEEERSQWRELWDRERSTWETQRQEFSTWEKSLRKEREAWHAEIQSNENNQVRFVEKINESLRQSTETSTKLAGVMRILRGVAPGLIPPEPKSQIKRLILAGAALALLAAAVPLWKHFTRIRLVPAGLEVVVAENPTSMAFDGEVVWISEWDGRILSFSPADMRKTLSTDVVPGVAPYHPAALASGGAMLWSLDEAQARILKHEAGHPAKVLSSRATPGPAPTALAFDGEKIWVYDAVSKALFSASAEAGDFTPHAFDPEVVPTAMLWKGEDFWVYDSHAALMRLYRMEEGRLTLIMAQKLDVAVLGLAASGDELWILAGPGMDRPGYALLKYGY